MCMMAGGDGVRCTTGRGRGDGWFAGREKYSYPAKRYCLGVTIKAYEGAGIFIFDSNLNWHNDCLV